MGDFDKLAEEKFIEPLRNIIRWGKDATKHKQGRGANNVATYLKELPELLNAANNLMLGKLQLMENLERELQKKDQLINVLEARLSERTACQSEMISDLKDLLTTTIKESVTQQLEQAGGLIPLQVTQAKSYAEALDFPKLPQKDESREITLKRLMPSVQVKDVKKVLNNFSSKEFDVETCHYNKEGDVIIKCKNDEKAIELKSYLQKNPVLTTMVDIGNSKPRLRKIIIHGAPEDFTNEQLQVAIEGAIPQEANAKIEIKKTLPATGNGIQSIVIETQNYIAKYLLDKGKILIGFNSCTVRIYVSVTRCFKCNRYGHVATKCHFHITCGFCSENHKTEECNNKENRAKHWCINCKEDKRREAFHTAFSSGCPIFRLEFQEAKKALEAAQAKFKPQQSYNLSRS